MAASKPKPKLRGKPKSKTKSVGDLSRSPTVKKPTAQQQELADYVIENARATGLLPHEILLKGARGEPFIVKRLVVTRYKSGKQKGEVKSEEWEDYKYYPSYNEQMDCAKAAAPYYAPKLQKQTVSTDEKTTEALTQVMKELSKSLPV